MKKLVCILLAACLMTAALAGCGGKKDDETSSAPAPSPQVSSAVSVPEVAQTAKALRVTADSGLNIRAEASTDSEILGLAENGERLALMVEDPQDGWYQIQYEGETAYVSSDYAEVIEVTVEEYNRLRSGETAGDATSTPAPSSASSKSSSQSDSSSQSESSTSSNSVDAEDGE